MNAEIIVKPFLSMPCCLSEFTVNGVKASIGDFGEKEHHGSSYIDGDCQYQFNPFIARQEVLDKYKIDTEDYDNVCNELERVLKIENCAWCSVR